MSAFIGLFLVVCLNPANHATCTKLPIVDSTQVELTMTGCMGVEGQVSAIKYWEEHPDLHKAYQFGGWSCQIGNKKAPDRGAA
jgi:hypothetical protein